jgi:serine protease AprX
MYTAIMRSTSAILTLALAVGTAFAADPPQTVRTPRSVVWAGIRPKLAPDLQKLDPNAVVDVIVQYKDTPTEAHHQKVRHVGGLLHRRLEVIKGGHYSIPVAGLQELANDPDIEFISPDREVMGLLDLTGSAVNAGAAATYKVDGTGIGVAILDSGVTDRWDLDTTVSPYPSRIVYSQDFTGSASTNDVYGHGTHVAGIVAGSANASSVNVSRSFKGMAPKANIINLKVLNDQGMGSDSNVIAAIQQAIALKSQ